MNYEGLKIKEVRSMTKVELNGEGWDSRYPVVCIVLEDGTKLYPSRDEEGNGPGAIFGIDGTSKDTILLLAEEKKKDSKST